MVEIILEMEIEMMGCNNFSVFVFLIYFFYSFYLMMFLLAPGFGFSSFAIEIIQLTNIKKDLERHVSVREKIQMIFLCCSIFVVNL